MRIPEQAKKVISSCGEIGIPTGGQHHCRLEGCSGVRIATRWLDGERTFPCTKGMDYDEEQEAWIIP
jgi:hypothetical protein